MFEPYLAALISCLAFSGVILMDMVMRHGVYSRSSQPLVISCALNAIFAAPILLFFEWHNPPLETIVLGLLAGVALALANGVYFWLMFSPAGETTEIGCWDAMGPLVIVFLTAILPSMHPIGSVQIVGIILAPIAILMLHLWGEKYHLTTWRYRIGLMTFAILNGIQMFLLGRAEEEATKHFISVGVADPQRSAFAVAYPFYWIGLLVGVLPILMKSVRTDFADNWPTMRRKWRVIMAIELLATLAFAAQAYGFSGAHPAVIGLIVGMFPIPIFLGGILLRRYGGQPAEKFPLVKHPIRKICVILLVIAAVALAAARW